MGRFIDLLIDITSSPGFKRAHLQTVTKPLALILLGGLRELTAHTLEDGDDVRGMVLKTAVSACIGLISAGLCTGLSGPDLPEPVERSGTDGEDCGLDRRTIRQRGTRHERPLGSNQQGNR